MSCGTVHKFLCERDQAIRCSYEFEVCVLRRISDVVKTETIKNCFSFQNSKNPPCQTAPQTGASLQRKARGHVRANNPLRETVSVSLARFTSGSSKRDRPAQKPSGTLCQKISDCHALCVLALHGVVPRLAVCLHSLFVPLP